MSPISQAFAPAAPSRSPSAPGPWRGVALAISIVAALRLVYVIVRYSAYDVAKYFLADDSFYYFQVARKIANGLGSTFDGVHVTNGYHPLWMLIATAVFRLVPGVNAPLVVLYALQIAMIVGSAWVLYLALRELDDLAAAFTAALFLAAHTTRSILFIGMESAPAFLLASCLLLLAMRWGRRFFLLESGRDALLLFTLLLLLSLARLEAGLVAAVWLVMALAMDAWHGGRSRGRILLVALGLAVAACAYVAMNLALVGVPVPISGLVKAGGGIVWARGWYVLSLHWIALAGLLALPGWAPGAWVVNGLVALLVTIALVLLLRELGRRDPVRLLGLAPLLVFAAMFSTISSFITRGSFGWYLWPALFVGVLATFAAVRLWLRYGAPARLGAAVVVAGALFTTAAGWVAVVRTRTLADWGPLPGIAMDSTLRYIREEIPAADRMGAISSGIFTYFSGRDIENLEGLANGVEFYRARLDPKTYGEYLKKNRIRWVVFYTAYSGQRAKVLGDFEQACGVDSVVDLDTHYRLGLREMTPQLSDPNVVVARLTN